MALKTERVIYTAKNNSTGLTDVVANIRRNGTSVATAVGLTEIGNGRYELLLTPTTLNGYGGSGYYDFYINSASRSAPATAARWILENDRDDLQSQIAGAEAKIDILDTNLDSVKTTVESTNSTVLNATYGLPNLKSLIDSITSAVTNISNVTRYSSPIPNPLVKLEVGTKVYALKSFLYDTEGNMEDPDSNQIKLEITDESGNSRDSYINGFTVQPHYITRDAVGQYSYQLGIPDTADNEQLNLKFTYVENGITIVQGATTEVIPEAAAAGTALESTSQTILEDTADMQPRVLDIQTKINDASYGLAALKALIDTIDSVVDSIATLLANGTFGLSALKDILDGKASQASVNDVQGVGFATATDSLQAISERTYTGGTAI